MRTPKQQPRLVLGRNEAQHAAAVGRARSSAAGPHDPRPRRQRNRGAQKRAALRDQREG